MLDANAYQLSKTVSNNLIRQCELLGKKLSPILLAHVCVSFKVDMVDKVDISNYLYVFK